jgi:hypothetical protein
MQVPDGRRLEQPVTTREPRKVQLQERRVVGEWKRLITSRSEDDAEQVAVPGILRLDSTL